MFKQKLLLTLVAVFLAVHPCLAQESAKVVGIWKLISFEAEIQATDQKEPVHT
jgi:hypothetical protein